jgi:hypothetical protein
MKSEKINLSRFHSFIDRTNTSDFIKSEFARRFHYVPFIYKSVTYGDSATAWLFDFPLYRFNIPP